MTRRSVLVARRTFLLHRQQLEDLHRALPVPAGQEREAVRERLRRSEIVGLDDCVADEIASWSFSAVVANGGEPEAILPGYCAVLENRLDDAGLLVTNDATLAGTAFLPV